LKLIEEEKMDVHDEGQALLDDADSKYLQMEDL
jgi:hypothetical protein